MSELTKDVEVERVALSIPLGVEADARVVAGATPTDSLQHQTLVTDDDPVVHVVMEDLTLNNRHIYC